MLTLAEAVEKWGHIARALREEALKIDFLDAEKALREFLDKDPAFDAFAVDDYVLLLSLPSELQVSYEQIEAFGEWLDAWIDKQSDR